MVETLGVVIKDKTSKSIRPLCRFTTQLNSGECINRQLPGHYGQLMEVAFSGTKIAAM
jgi:hypothetical protein